MAPSDSRFLHLPREVRDLIYSYLIISVREKTPQNVDVDDTVQYLLDAPDTCLLLVSKQFASEYRDVLPRQHKLIVICDTCENFIGFPENKASFRAAVHDLTVYLHIQCYCDHMSDEERRDFFEETWTACDGADFLDEYRDRLEHYLKDYPNLESVHVRVGLWSAEDKAVEWPLTSHTPGFNQNLQEFTRLENLRSIQVVKCSSQDDYWHFTRSSIWRWKNKFTDKMEYRLGRGTHQLSTFAKYAPGKGWQGENGRHTAYAWGSIHKSKDSESGKDQS